MCTCSAKPVPLSPLGGISTLEGTAYAAAAFVAREVPVRSRTLRRREAKL
jgi:hypothetical protein